MDVLNRYRDHHSSSDDDSEDSDKECTVWKRATGIKRSAEDEAFQNVQSQDENLPNIQGDDANVVKPKRKRNTIWTEVLQDQLISEDFEDCLLKNKPAHYDSRGKESYDYTLKYADPRVMNDAECPMDEESSDDQRKSSRPPYNKSKMKKFVKLDGAEHTAARKIIKVLNEKKVYLIQRIVKFVGIEKAMTLLSMTEEIEDNGGMMIKNNARRRTPGGVYLQLLKSDKDITQETLDKIFEGEMSCEELKKYYSEKKKKKKPFRKGKKDRKSIKNTSEKQNILESTDLQKMESNDLNMDGEEVNETSSSHNSSLENDSPPEPLASKTPNNSSDLEEGEIED